MSLGYLAAIDPHGAPPHAAAPTRYPLPATSQPRPTENCGMYATATVRVEGCRHQRQQQGARVPAGSGGQR
ncbi:hypothetical protein B0H14DRAFT_3486520 [Mycena olivaceomarginata]|nr:hypothetical protein B0H14DRAFT_3486520 [Mycena olivaceomarginata]